MNTSIDRFGRIVIPKEVRDDLGLDAGSVLRIETTRDGAIALYPAAEGHPLWIKEGITVYGGRAEEDLRDAVSRHRAGRLRRLSRRRKA
jgi:AbrB family looped-hinge helix DNA binding protein